MRCRPGDLAQVVGGVRPECAHLIGKRIVVTTSTEQNGVMFWNYVAMDGQVFVDAYGMQLPLCADRCLLPIRIDGGEQVGPAGWAAKTGEEG